jgi:sigma-B regulation protein RsbU (phosphoserine phosphatase)
VDIYASLVPAKEVGGDLYDFNIRDGKLFFCIGDVAGKGVPASLVMAVTRSLFRIVSDHEDQPETIVMDINESLFEMNDSDMFVTLFVGVLDLATGLLRYCNAGHEEPLLIGKGVGLLPSANNIPVGLMQGRSFEGQDAYIYPGTTIFLYTDGLTEAEDATHAQYGKQRLTRTARQALASNKYDPETIVKVQTDALHSFVGNAEQSDDLTMLAIRYNEAES